MNVHVEDREVVIRLTEAEALNLRTFLAYSVPKGCAPEDYEKRHELSKVSQVLVLKMSVAMDTGPYFSGS